MAFECVSVKGCAFPILKTALLERRSKSSPITALFATERPPSVCNEPSVVDVASVVSSDFSIPEKVPVVAARAAKEPAAVEAPPITAPSIVPPLMSAVVTVPK